MVIFKIKKNLKKKERAILLQIARDDKQICWTWNSYEFLEKCSLALFSFLGFEIFVGWIFVSIDLHVGHVSLLWRHSLINLNEALPK